MNAYQIDRIVTEANEGDPEALDTIIDALESGRDFVTTCALALSACDLTAAGVGIAGLNDIKAVAELAAEKQVIPAAARALTLLAVVLCETLDAAKVSV